MKKIYFVLIFLFTIILITVFAIFLFSPKDMVEIVASTLENQEKVNKKLSCYGYSIDNPKVILNPYENSPLSAIIMFETDERISFNINVKGKNNNDIVYKEKEKSKEHYIVIYGLYQDYENKVVLSADNMKKEITIVTDKVLDIDVSTISVDIKDDITIFSSKDYIFGIDKYGELRYYLNGGYTGDLLVTDNNHLIISSNRKTNDGKSTGILEIDLLGKIYYEYNLIDGYNFLIDNVNETKMLVLGENIVEIDRQTGTYIKEYNLNDIVEEWEELIYVEDSSEVIIYSDNVVLIYDYETTDLKRIYGNIELSDKLSTLVVDEEIPSKYNRISYGDIIDYEYLNLKKDIYFVNSKFVNISKYKETKTSDKNISIFLYSSYTKEIKVQQEYDRLVIEGNFNKNDEVYVILDKFLGKRVYELDTNTSVLYINNYGLSGRYSLYLSVNNNLYKLNKYVSF